MRSGTPRTPSQYVSGTTLAWAQQTAISGRGTDSQGAALSGASVAVKQVGGAT